MLYHLRRKQTSDRPVWLGEQIAQRIAGRGIQSVLATHGRHLVIQIDTTRGNAFRFE
jgi:hypothetical protein